MYPGHWADVKPTTLAVIDAVSGAGITWQELDQRSNQVALIKQNNLQDFDDAKLLPSSIELESLI